MIVLFAGYILYCTGGFPTGITDFLGNRGHLIHCEGTGYAVVQGVGVANNDHVTTHSDSRKQALGSTVD